MDSQRAKRAVILAAGRGSRMKELTEAIPKCLVEVRGRTLLDRQIDSLRSAGIEEIALVTGYRRDMLVGRADHEFHNGDWARTNMVSSLACADAWLSEQTCVVSYSDIFFEAQAVGALITAGGDLAVAYDVHWLALWTRRFGDPLIDAETFRLDAAGRLLEIGNVAAALDQVQGQYMGLLRFSPAGWAEVTRLRRLMTPQDRDTLHMTATLQRVLACGRVPITAVPFDGEWGEVDSAEDLALYRQG